MDFGIQIYGGIRITDDITIYITETLLITWIIMGILIAFAIVVRIKSRKWSAMGKPTGLQNVVELLVQSFENLFKNSAGEKVKNLAPWFFTLFTFLIFANTIGVIGPRPPTADWAMTFPLAVSSLIMIQYAGIRHRPKEYLKGFVQPIFLFLPINLLGELSKPIALSFRLFGNILAGTILMSMLYGLAPLVVTIGLPAVLHAYFDVAAGLLQAYIFTILSITFVGLASEG